jgi:hypothetical protein
LLDDIEEDIDKYMVKYINYESSEEEEDVFNEKFIENNITSSKSSINSINSDLNESNNLDRKIKEIQIPVYSFISKTQKDFKEEKNVSNPSLSEDNGIF